MLEHLKISCDSTSKTALLAKSGTADGCFPRMCREGVLAVAITSMGGGTMHDAGTTSAGLTLPGFNDFPFFLVQMLWQGFFEGGALPTLEALEVAT